MIMMGYLIRTSRTLTETEVIDDLDPDDDNDGILDKDEPDSDGDDD